MAPTWRYRLSPGRKRLKRRLVLASMIFCGVVLGVLISLRTSTPIAEGNGLSGAGDGLQHVNGMSLASQGRWSDESGRSLSGSADCDVQLNNGGEAVVYVLGVLYCFLGLAIVCDEFFQTSLEIISEVLELTPDVAGATFLAAGSSAPELFTSLVDAFGDSNSTGTGTIVGSAMFNILVIVALSAAVAAKGGGAIPIDWRPVCRDVAFYSVSIILLTAVFLDGRVEWWEGLIMVFFYFVYILFMKFNSRILERCQPGAKISSTEGVANPWDVAAAVKAVGSNKRPSQMGVEDPAKVSPLPEDPVFAEAGMGVGGLEENAATGGVTLGNNNGDRKRLSRSQSLGSRHRAERKMSNCSNDSNSPAADLTAANSDDSGNMGTHELVPIDNNQAGTGDKRGAGDAQLANIGDLEAGSTAVGQAKEGRGSGDGDGDGDENESRFAWPDKLGDQVLFLLGLPLLCLFSLTIPDCGKEKMRKWFVLSFVMSLLWIGLLTHYMVAWVTVVGCYLNVSPIFMGLVVLAVGTSVPDALGSMIAARNGEANMAIANAVGSNVFDVLAGLGFPWFLRGLYYGEPMPVNRDGIAANVAILFCTALLFLFILYVNKWSMSIKTGMLLFSLYILYITQVIISEVVS